MRMRQKWTSEHCHQMKILFHTIIVGISYWGCSISNLPHIWGKFLGRWEAGLYLTVYRQPVRDSIPEALHHQMCWLQQWRVTGSAKPGTVVPTVPRVTQAGSSGEMLAVVPLSFLLALFCSFLFLYKWKDVITLKVRELTMGSLSISDYSRHSYLVAKATEYKD